MTSGLIVVVEQRSDAAIFRRLIARSLDVHTRFFVSRGQSIGSLARSILRSEGGPVLAVPDTFTTNADKVEEARGTMHFAISMVAPEAAFEVHAFSPEADVIFYEAPCVLERHFGREICGMELELGGLDPRRQLERLLVQNGMDRDTFHDLLDDRDLDCLLRGPQMQRLIAAADTLLGRVARFAHA